MKVSVLTLGCKANQAESFLIEATLRTRGCTIVGLDEGPDYCVINTCSVTSKSDYQSRQIIRRAAKTGCKVIVTGCYSELNKDYVKSMKGVSEVVCILDKNNIPGMLATDISCNALYYNSQSRSRFFLKVQDGCNYSCSYCIIPAARGKSRSVPLAEIIERVAHVSSVYSEVVLTGIHLGTYGYDLASKLSLSDLLSTLLVKTKIRRIRLSSLEIGEIDAKLLDLMQEERVCKHLHIPLQSGDDGILALMKRKYTAGQFLGGVSKIVQRIPRVAIGTDVIAGFPGEGEVEFNNTFNLLESLPLSYMHVFPFSRREGTEASRMTQVVDPVSTRERCSLLRELGARKRNGYMASQVGRTLELLVEEIRSPGTIVGTTGNYLKVAASCSDAYLKKIVPVRIAGVENNMLVGQPIGDV